MKRPQIDQQVTFLHTHDLLATAKFYEEMIQLPVVLDQGTCRIYHVSNGAFLGFCQHLQASKDPQGIIITLVTPDVDE